MGLEDTLGDTIATPRQKNPYHFKLSDFVPLYGLFSFVNRAEKISRRLEWKEIDAKIESAPIVNSILLFCYNAAAGAGLTIGIHQLCHYLK